MEVMIMSEMYKIQDRPMVAMDTVSIPMTLSDIERRDVRGQFFGGLCLYDWPRMIKFGRVTGEGEACFKGLTTPPSQGTWPQRPPDFWDTYFCENGLTWSNEV